MGTLLEDFGRAFEAAPTALLVVDDRGRIVLANADVNELFGYEATELVGESIELLVPEEFRDGHPELREAYQTLPHRRTMGSGRDLFGVTKSGRLIPVEIGLNAIHTREGTYSVASVLDMTAQLAEQHRTRQAIDASASAMVMIDAKGKIALANKAASKMFQIEHDRLVGAAIEQLIPQRFHRRHVVYRTSFAAEPSDRKMGAEGDLYGIRSDGTEFPVEVGLTAIDHDSGRMIMATVIDMSERVRYEAEILRQNEGLARLNDDLTQFAYSASHDLKAPLTTLQGILALIGEDVTDGNVEEAVLNAGRARELAGRLGGLIESTLGLAQSQELATTEAEPIDLRDMVDHIRQSLDGLFQAHGVEYRNHVPDDCAPFAQETRLRQIIDNLVSNAVKYSDPAKDPRLVQVSAELQPDTLVIVVEDNGIGIPAEAADHVFKRFRRFANHEVEGTGIGLALVKQHVDRLGGEISYASSPAGTTFEVRLPSSSLAGGEAAGSDSPVASSIEVGS